MKNKLMIITAILALMSVMPAFAIGKGDTDATKRATKTHQFRCTDKNTSLYFVIYEVNGDITTGHMYVENMQVAVLSAQNAGTNVIKASVNGNTASNIAFQLHKSPGKVMVANYGPNPGRVEVCSATYKYQ